MSEAKKDPSKYVLIFPNDGVDKKKGPLVMEQYLNSASLEEIKIRKEILEKRYGECQIAKIEIIKETK